MKLHIRVNIVLFTLVFCFFSFLSVDPLWITYNFILLRNEETDCSQRDRERGGMKIEFRVFRRTKVGSKILFKPQLLSILIGYIRVGISAFFNILWCRTTCWSFVKFYIIMRAFYVLFTFTLQLYFWFLFLQNITHCFCCSVFQNHARMKINVEITYSKYR